MAIKKLYSTAALLAATFISAPSHAQESADTGMTSVCLRVDGKTGILSNEVIPALGDYLVSSFPEFYSFVTDEVCNGVDDDCDAEIDEGCSVGPEPVCTNGIVEEGEECDDGNTFNYDGCTNDCKIRAHCGNGIIEGLEQCDDGNNINGDGCSRRCRIEAEVAPARCGDGVVNQSSESCDDGNASNTDACTNDCQIARCGDGFIQVGVEECEVDANGEFEETCNENCLLAVQYEVKVRSSDGFLLPGARLTQTRPTSDTLVQVTTDDQGIAQLRLEQSSTRYVFHVELDGYTDQVVEIQTPDFSTNIELDVVLKRREIAELYPIGDDFLQATVPETGASVTFEYDAFTGPVAEVYATAVDVSTISELSAFPGTFMGTPDDASQDTAIVSMGLVEFSFRDFDRQEVDLRPGQSAQIRIPIYRDTLPEGTEVEEGMNIALWSLNEETGIWGQEGVGTVIRDEEDRFMLEATVTHFSWWNCDVAVETAQTQVLVSVNGDTSAAIGVDREDLYAYVRAYAKDISRGPASAVVQLETRTEPMIVPAIGADVCIYADICVRGNPDRCIASTSETCVIPDPNTTFPLDLDISVAQPGELGLDVRASAARSFDETNNIIEVISGHDLSLDVVPTELQLEVNYEIIEGELPPGIEATPSGNTLRISGRAATPNPQGERVLIRASNDNTTTDLELTIKVIDRETLPLDLSSEIRPIEWLPAWTPLPDPIVFNLQTSIRTGAVRDWRNVQGPFFSRVESANELDLIPGTQVQITPDGYLFLRGFSPTEEDRFRYLRSVIVTLEAFDLTELRYKTFEIRCVLRDRFVEM